MPLAELLERQDRLILRAQAVAAGFTRAAIDGHLRRERWRRVLPNVYLTESISTAQLPDLPPRQRIRAVWMWAGEDAVVSGDAAAHWVGSLERASQVSVIVPPTRRLSAQRGVRVIRAYVDRRDVTVRDGILLTDECRTALDLAALGRNDVLHRMAQRNRLSPRALQAALDRGTHRKGWSAARAAVRASLTNPHSEAERLTHRAMLASGITRWRANPELVINGRTIRPDIAFDDVPLIVEIDGYDYHSDRDAFESDRFRQNLLIAAGWTVLRFTWRQVSEDPAAVVAQIAATTSMLRERARE